MTTATIIEYIGYFASGFVLLSFLNKNIKTIRYVNAVGCVLFITYGAFISSAPIIISNAGILLIHFYYLFIHKQKKETTN